MDITIKEFLEAYESGKYASYKDIKENRYGGWYDWFCSDSSLVSRTKKFYNLLKSVKNPYILDNFTIWFKNNCPVNGPLYDDLRFEPVNQAERNQKYFGIQFDCVFNEHKYGVFTARDGYRVEFQFDNLRDLRKWLEEWNG